MQFDVVDHLIFQTMNSVGSNSLSLKYQRFTSSSCEDILIRKFKFVARTQFLCYLRKIRIIADADRFKKFFLLFGLKLLFLRVLKALNISSMIFNF